MPLVSVDFAQLEWRVACQLAHDETGIQEIINGVDYHTANAEQFFKDKSKRQDAKVLGFRILYGGGPYAFFMDPKMPKYSLEEWEAIVAGWYRKYSGIAKWHNGLIESVVRNNGKVQAPTGRIYTFQKHKNKDGSNSYSDTQIKNYMCQGTAGGDIVPLVMTEVRRWVKSRNDLRSLFWNQVHDSLEFDCPPDEVDIVVTEVLKIVRNTPSLVKAKYGMDWIVPMDGDAKVGNNWMEMKAWQTSSI